jgi:beta-lactamase superfamily II metal-dependent hydrolase
MSEREPFPDGSFKAQVDKVIAVQDYSPLRRCVRLIGISDKSFSNKLFNTDGGCQTYVIDLSWTDLLPRLLLYPRTWMSFSLRKNLLEMLEDAPPGIWLDIRFTKEIEETGSYAYEAFADSEPTYLSIKSVRFIVGPTVEPIALGTAKPAPASIGVAAARLTAFHVGQGMCSLMEDGRDGYLLDAGAGTPVRRPIYRAGVKSGGGSFRNDLLPLIGSLSLNAIVSHPDSDHWRLLDWDITILSKLTSVYLPAGQPALAFSSPAIKKKVIGIGDTSFSFSGGDSLEVRRSQPNVSDKNGECLVCVAYCGGKMALMPGDYVYDRMAVDFNTNIQAMMIGFFDAVVVPHHGDHASASAIVAPKNPNLSVAFFSAGTRSGYGHPTAASLNAHRARNFDVVDNHRCDDIIARQLLP